MEELSAGLVSANLGNGLFKQRVARSGQGKRGGHRMLLASKNKERTVFMFGFSKNDRGNLDESEKEVYKKLAKMYLDAPISTLKDMCSSGRLIEVL